MSDWKAWGYVIALVIIIGAFVSLITKAMDVTAFSATLTLGVGVGTATSALRATTAATANRVADAVVTGTVDRSIRAKMAGTPKP